MKQPINEVKRMQQLAGLLLESQDDIVSNLVKEFNQYIQDKYPKIFDPIREKYFSSLIPLNYKSPGSSIWKLKPGESTFKNWGEIYVDKNGLNYPIYGKHKFEKLFFPWLLNKTNNSSTFKIKGEFKTDNYDDALVYKNILFVNRENKIEYGSVNRLKNTKVWNKS